MGHNIKLEFKAQGPNGSGGPMPYNTVVENTKNTPTFDNVFCKNSYNMLPSEHVNIYMSIVAYLYFLFSYLSHLY